LAAAALATQCTTAGGKLETQPVVKQST
jgi:hypothetical protein